MFKKRCYWEPWAVKEMPPIVWGRKTTVVLLRCAQHGELMHHELPGTWTLPQVKAVPEWAMEKLDGATREDPEPAEASPGSAA